MNTEFRTREPHDWWNTVALGVAVVIAFLMLWLGACSSVSQSAANSNKAAAKASDTPTPPASASPVNTMGESVPTSLADAGEYGENVYDYAKANDWKNAEARLGTLNETLKKVRADVKSQGAAVDRLDGNVAALGRAVSTKDRQATMREANQVTLDVANMTTAYKLRVPVEVTMLDYYGRELEVWAQAKDANKLQATAREMRRTWDALRPSVQSRNAAEAKKFEALVARVEAAQTPVDYERVAKPVLDEVDNLEKVFHG
ncbi:MAG TPA: hypothetical protein VGC66_11055 [Pyrinomonadaceae bacterium]|jgi:hypothetical protein